MLTDICNDLGFPRVCFPSLSVESLQLCSAACCRKATASSIAATTSEVTGYTIAPGMSQRRGKKDSTSFLRVVHHSHTMQTEAWEISSDSETLCLWLGGWRSAGKALHWPAERCAPPASSICTGVKGLGFSLEDAIFSSICQALGTPQHFIKH